jgi:hypothetical protein
LAQAIETVVNQVRNRFTSIDVEASYCPDPFYRILHGTDVLFTAGPCLLGPSMNRVLGRRVDTSFHAGLLNTTTATDSAVVGRTIILHQVKQDMGAHRFTNTELHLIVAASDLQGSENMPNKEKKVMDRDHYTQLQNSNGIYGLHGLYHNDTQSANENIRIVVENAVVAKSR